jgi:hypothetical protein
MEGKMKKLIYLSITLLLLLLPSLSHSIDFNKYQEPYSPIKIDAECKHTAIFCELISRDRYHDTHILISQCPDNPSLFHAQAFSIINDTELIWWKMWGSTIANGSHERPDWIIYKITNSEDISKNWNKPLF